MPHRRSIIPTQWVFEAQQLQKSKRHKCRAPQIGRRDGIEQSVRL